MPGKIKFFTWMFSLLLTLTINACKPPSTDPARAEWQRAVDGMASLTHGLRAPDHLLNEDARRLGGEFDVNAYFEILEHLSMEPGYTLDYVYYYDFMAGNPVLYARKVDEPANQTYSEYAQKQGDPATDYLNHVQTDGTDEGFFQLIVLRMMGSQFYLWWHANYNDFTPITSWEALQARLDSAEEMCSKSTGEVGKQATRLDLSPTFEYAGEYVTVKVYAFSNWGGLRLFTYTIQRQFPHHLQASGFEIRIPYDCGIVF
jgi:hypothetical protein